MSHDINLDLIPESVRASVLALIQANQAKEITIKLLREELRLALIKKYGAKSEKLSDAQLQLLELEPGVHAAEIETEANHPPGDLPPVEPAPGKSRSKPPGRHAFPESLPRTVVVVPLCEADCICKSCSGQKDLIAFEESEQLHVVPAIYSVLVTRREKRACSKCSEMGVQTAHAPQRLIPKGKLSDAFIIEVLIRKYVEHMPVYRQCASILRDAGVEVSRQTLVDDLMAVGSILVLLVRAMKVDLFKEGYIQADETPMPVQTKAVRGRNHRAYFWQYSRPGGPVIFDFRMGRAREGPLEFLAGYTGWLQCDGYSAYDKLGEGIRFAGCLAHARRRFHEAGLLAPSAPEPKEILALFAKIYAIEVEARNAGMGAKARLELRQAKTRPLMDQLKRRAAEIRQNVLPKSALGKACTYTLKQWDRLEMFLSDGVLLADNNWCENGMRGVAIGRKGWLHLGSEVAGPKVAAIYSVIETCKRLGINVREYLNDVLPRLGDWPVNRIGELTPSAWKASRAS